MVIPPPKGEGGERSEPGGGQSNDAELVGITRRSWMGGGVGIEALSSFGKYRGALVTRSLVATRAGTAYHLRSMETPVGWSLSDRVDTHLAFLKVALRHAVLNSTEARGARASLSQWRGSL
jgi:hypothetical protein